MRFLRVSKLLSAVALAAGVCAEANGPLCTVANISNSISNCPPACIIGATLHLLPASEDVTPKSIHWDEAVSIIAHALGVSHLSPALQFADKHAEILNDQAVQKVRIYESGNRAARTHFDSSRS